MNKVLVTIHFELTFNSYQKENSTPNKYKLTAWKSRISKDDSEGYRKLNND